MQAIDIDFEVFKELTARRPREEVSYNDVIRELLGLDALTDSETPPIGGGCVFLGVHFPEGTRFGVTYKGVDYEGSIKNGRWIGGDGIERSSPSDAARAVTGTNVNGWRFWHVKRPSDVEWKRMDQLR
ncbi:MAG TPA: DUF4357 domain-containing protein [Sphingobium sp.]